MTTVDSGFTLAERPTYQHAIVGGLKLTSGKHAVPRKVTNEPKVVLAHVVDGLSFAIIKRPLEAEVASLDPFVAGCDVKRRSDNTLIWNALHVPSALVLLAGLQFVVHDLRDDLQARSSQGHQVRRFWIDIGPFPANAVVVFLKSDH
eukprot:scaffold174_cov185-Pinguiococcus_pyrenoidosus.AAC.1